MKNIYLENNNYDKKIKELQIYSVDLIRKGIITKEKAIGILKQEHKYLTKESIFNFISNILLNTYARISINNKSKINNILIFSTTLSFIIQSIKITTKMPGLKEELDKIMPMSEEEHTIYQLEKTVNKLTEIRNDMEYFDIDTYEIDEEINNYQTVLEEVKYLIKK